MSINSRKLILLFPVWAKWSSSRFFVTTISLIASAMSLTGHIFSGSSAVPIASRSLAHLHG